MVGFGGRNSKDVLRNIHQEKLKEKPAWLVAASLAQSPIVADGGLNPAAVLNSHRSHFGSRYKLGCCGHAGLFGCWFDSLHSCVCTSKHYGYGFNFLLFFVSCLCSECLIFVSIYCEIICCFVSKLTDWIPFGDHPLKLERYRED